ATAPSYDVALRRGHGYSFRVAAIDAFGLATVSAPYDISLAQTSAKINLKASPKKGKRPLLVRFTSMLMLGDAAVSAVGRPVQFQSFDGTGWRVFARAKTGPKGTATARAKLRRGVNRVRARFAGSADLAAAVSSMLTLRVS